MPDQRLDSVWSAFWNLFGEYGMPLAMLSDNAPVFGGTGTWRLSQMDARLLRLGIQPIHGRPYHPQTQGKVERFHGTLARDLRDGLYAPNIEEAQTRLDQYRNFYNWVRPHEALGQRPPATVYRSSSRIRPSRLPKPTYASHLLVRTTSSEGRFTYKGAQYKAGKGLINELVAIDLVCKEEPIVWFCTHCLASLADLKA